jgi:hypothetical protein
LFTFTKEITTLDYSKEEFQSWAELFYEPGYGTFFATVALLTLVSYEEVERHLRYIGPRGIRPLIFPEAYSYSYSKTAAMASKIRDKVSFARHRSNSNSSMGSSSSEGSQKKGHKKLPPPVLVYHESARSIVFRDHLRRANRSAQAEETGSVGSEHAQTAPLPLNVGGVPVPPTYEEEEEAEQLAEEATDQIHDEHKHEVFGQDITDIANVFFPDHAHLNETNIEISGFQPNVVPLPSLELGRNDEFLALLESGANDEIDPSWTEAEKEVFTMLKEQRGVVKTIKNSDWTAFLHRFRTAHPSNSKYPDCHSDIAPHDHSPFNSFVTSTTVLPPMGRKMRCFGASAVYTTGVVFALPEFSSSDAESEAAMVTRTWSWPAGYSAKTEFNIDSRGNLINGRQEALVSLSTLREYNHDYTTKEDYTVAGRVIVGGLKTVPYNEVFVRVGGHGRAVSGKDCATGEDRNDLEGTGRSLETGVGLPVALFVRTPTFGHLISLFRTRARLLHVLGEKHIKGLPLLLISPEVGVRVLTETLQRDILKIAAKNLNPFQNPLLAHKTTINDTSESHMETKLEELIDLDESIRTTLTPEECARLAGGFGATDDSIAQILKEAMIQDKNSQKDGIKETDTHKLQDIVNEGLAAAVRSGDYYTSRQLLILYSLVSSEGHRMDIKEEKTKSINDASGDKDRTNKMLLVQKTNLDSAGTLIKRQGSGMSDVSNVSDGLPPPPAPAPLDTDRLRSATNSDGLLAVLGAAQVLKAMKDGIAKKRTEECVLAVEE